MSRSNKMNWNWIKSGPVCLLGLNFLKFSIKKYYTLALMQRWIFVLQGKILENYCRYQMQPQIFVICLWILWCEAKGPMGCHHASSSVNFRYFESERFIQLQRSIERVVPTVLVRRTSRNCMLTLTAQNSWQSLLRLLYLDLDLDQR